MFSGKSRVEFRRFAFEFPQTNFVKHLLNEVKMADLDWLETFMKSDKKGKVRIMQHCGMFEACVVQFVVLEQLMLRNERRFFKMLLWKHNSEFFWSISLYGAETWTVWKVY
jgi:hypothetical protein